MQTRETSWAKFKVSKMVIPFLRCISVEVRSLITQVIETQSAIYFPQVYVHAFSCGVGAANRPGERQCTGEGPEGKLGNFAALH